MTKLLDYALPLSAALLLLAFFWGLPDLRRCRLPRPSAAEKRLRAADLPLILLIAAAYAAVAFTGLGGRTDPGSFEPMEGRSATVELGEAPAKLMLYCGVGQGKYTLYTSDDGESWQRVLDFEQDHVAVLKWHELNLSIGEDFEALPAGRLYRISCLSGQPWLGEAVFLDAEGAPLPARSDLPALCDEADTVPAKQELENSTYFDEIYHARTAWEHLHGVWPYEISHPPLGKEILSLGILLFGMNPFGWRFMGTLFGVLMLPVMYAFLKRLLGGRWVPALGTLLLAADFMHFTQTRIATIDTYGVFFILLMYLFLYRWLDGDGLWALALSGISFGLGAASKWTGIYAGAGLGLLWLLHWLRLFLRSRSPGASPSGASPSQASPSGASPSRASPSGRSWHGEAVTDEGIRGSGTERASSDVGRSWHGEAVTDEGPSPRELLPAFLRNVGFCLIFFVAVPALIYYLSYLPYGRALGCGPFSRDYTHMVLENQRFMYTYHAGIVAEHPYSSRWYQWLLDIRPILYYLDYLPDGTRRSIAAFVNPALCWGGLLSLFVLLYAALFRRDRRAGFLLLGYLAQLLPWVFISRLTFAYHYFPCTVFLVLSLGYVFALLRDNVPRWLCWALPFTAAALGLFVLFWPVLSGAPADPAFADRFLQWLPTWPL